jgi:ATP-dependent Lon protease
MSEIVTISAEEQKLAEELADELPSTLPILPLKETVVFPASMTPLAIGQDRSIALIDDVIAGDRLLALVTVSNDDAETPGWDDI